MKYIVFFAKPYDFINKQNVRVKGVTLSYVDCKPSENKNEFGYPPFMVHTSSLNDVDFSKLVFPGVYDMDFEMIPDSNSKAQLVLNHMKFVRAVEIA